MEAKRSKKGIVFIVAIVACLALAVGGVYMWLTDSTESETNTFTVGNIDIALAETTTDYKMVPGNDIAKDPTITVEANSEDCYLFVKVDESSNFDDFMTYAMADGWTALSGVTGVYYQEVSAATTDQAFQVLAGDTDHLSCANGKVTVKDEVTKTMMDELTDATLPTLTFTAYAVQQANVADAAAAWALAVPAAA